MSKSANRDSKERCCLDNCSRRDIRKTIKLDLCNMHSGSLAEFQTLVTLNEGNARFLRRPQSPHHPANIVEFPLCNLHRCKFSRLLVDNKVGGESNPVCKQEGYDDGVAHGLQTETSSSQITASLQQTHDIGSLVTPTNPIDFCPGMRQVSETDCDDVPNSVIRKELKIVFLRDAWRSLKCREMKSVAVSANDAVMMKQCEACNLVANSNFRRRLNALQHQYYSTSTSSSSSVIDEPEPSIPPHRQHRSTSLSPMLLPPPNLDVAMHWISRSIQNVFNQGAWFHSHDLDSSNNGGDSSSCLSRDEILERCSRLYKVASALNATPARFWINQTSTPATDLIISPATVAEPPHRINIGPCVGITGAHILDDLQHDVDSKIMPSLQAGRISDLLMPADDYLLETVNGGNSKVIYHLDCIRAVVADNGKWPLHVSELRCDHCSKLAAVLNRRARSQCQTNLSASSRVRHDILMPASRRDPSMTE